jgi:quercetin dioxygenase-like cupin family protein
VEIRSTQNTAEDPEIPARPGWEGMHVWWLVTRETAEAATLVVNETVIPPNKWHEVHKHPHAEEAMYVLEGSGLHLTEEASHRLTAGDVVFIARDEWHGFANDTDNPVRVIGIFGGVSTYPDAGYDIHPTQPAHASPPEA